jgi:hypothetical protein
MVRGASCRAIVDDDLANVAQTMAPERGWKNHSRTGLVRAARAKISCTRWVGRARRH